MKKLNKFDLSNQVAVVTGAAGLLGVRHSMALVEAGATVYMTDLNLDRLKSLTADLNQTFQTDQFKCLLMDVTQKKSIETVLASILKMHSRIDILVNNAAIDPKVSNSNPLLETSRFENFDTASWDFQISVGLTGAFFCCQIFGSEMARQKKGIILNVASDLAVIAPDQRLYRVDGRSEELQPVKPVTYSVIKFALVGLTKYLASYWAKDGVRVNSISPGGVYNQQPEVFVDKIKQLIPMGRMAHKDEYEGTVQYLCSEASSYMTGQNIIVDGGRSII
jgi:NAD(P)-dependent dehydrogenase (short-subunit alcohol dehydrogenase family)